MSYRFFVVALLIHFAQVSKKTTASQASLKYDNQFPRGNKTKEHSMIIVMNRYPSSGDMWYLKLLLRIRLITGRNRATKVVIISKHTSKHTKNHCISKVCVDRARVLGNHVGWVYHRVANCRKNEINQRWLAICEADTCQYETRWNYERERVFKRTSTSILSRIKVYLVWRAFVSSTAFFQSCVLSVLGVWIDNG